VLVRLIESPPLVTKLHAMVSQNVFSGLQHENDDGLVESDDIATSQEN
jgi:hypothetical protein